MSRFLFFLFVKSSTGRCRKKISRCICVSNLLPEPVQSHPCFTCGGGVGNITLKQKGTGQALIVQIRTCGLQNLGLGTFKKKCLQSDQTLYSSYRCSDTTVGSCKTGLTI